jgi:hypothetical protein
MALLGGHSYLTGKRYVFLLSLNIKFGFSIHFHCAFYFMFGVNIFSYLVLFCAKSLIPSFEVVITNADHRICVRHLYANFRNEGYKGLLLKDKLWKAASTYIVHGFRREMEELKKMRQPAHAYLEKVDPHGWARAFFDTTSKCDLLMNNLCECFNSYNDKARDKQIITMLEMVRKKLMKWYQMKRDGIRSYVGNWSPKILEKFEVVKRRLESVTSFFIIIYKTQMESSQWHTDLSQSQHMVHIP